MCRLRVFCQKNKILYYINRPDTGILDLWLRKTFFYVKHTNKFNKKLAISLR